MVKRLKDLLKHIVFHQSDYLGCEYNFALFATSKLVVS